MFLQSFSRIYFENFVAALSALFTPLQWQWSWVCKVCICAPNVWKEKENVDFEDPLFNVIFYVLRTHF